jgi:hypothetical protein
VDTNPDTASPEDQAGISEEEARKLVEQLRSTPAERIIADVFSSLLSAAEVKLGRRDARLFIDLSAALLEYAGPYVSDELGKQVQSALGQLRLGQVSAESQPAKKGESEPNDLSRAPTPPKAGARAESPSGSGPAESPSSRLWIPGR